MPIESSVTLISDLNASYPENTDSIPNGANHLRNIKTAVKSLNTQNDSTKGAAQIGYADPLAASYLKTQSDINNGVEVSLFRFIATTKHSGIRAETNTDDLATSLQDAAANAKAIFVPYGKYHTSAPFAISKDGAHWRGQGINGTKIVGTVNNNAIITINTGLGGVQLEDFQLDRNITAISGAFGVDCGTVSIGQAMIRRLLVQNQFIGMRLGPTDYSEVEKVIVQKCLNDGIYMTNTATDGACQWSLENVLSQKNVGRGFIFVSAAGPAQVTLGTWKHIATFANTGIGVAVVGSAGVPVHDLRMVQCFIGEDGNSEIYLDTYGRNHQITGGIVELAGSRTTGPTLATAASSIGSGIEVTSNNTNCQINGVISDANSLDGFYVSGTTQSLTGCTATNNGQAATAGRRNGINSAGGRVAVTGGNFGNTGAGTSQQYGAFVGNGNNLSIVGGDYTGNSVAPWGATANSSYIQAVGTLPNTNDVLLSGQGSVVVGGGATGGASIAGGINVAGGLAKNNTAYTNP